MKLLELEIECIKNVVRDDNQSFSANSKQAFDEFRNNAQYSDFINNVMSDINQAFARLVSSEKLPKKTIYKEYTSSDSVGERVILDLGEYKKQIYKVKKILFAGDKKPMQEVHFIPLADNKILITNMSPKNKGLFLVVYSIKIPRLDHDRDYDLDVDDEFGITDNICYSFVLNYTKSKLWESEEPQLSQNYMNYAEKFLNDFVEEEEDVVQESVYSDMCYM